jgi:hypothetical protein
VETVFEYGQFLDEEQNARYIWAMLDVSVCPFSLEIMLLFTLLSRISNYRIHLCSWLGAKRLFSLFVLVNVVVGGSLVPLLAQHELHW